MAEKNNGTRVIAENRKARHDYFDEGVKMNEKSVTLAIHEVAEGKLSVADANVNIANVEG